MHTYLNTLVFIVAAVHVATRRAREVLAQHLSVVRCQIQLRETKNLLQVNTRYLMGIVVPRDYSDGAMSQMDASL